jgi:hypothetical protein
MKKFILSLLTIVVICLCAFATGVAAQSDSRFFTGGISDIHPKGWLETMLKRQHDGLTGHPEASSSAIIRRLSERCRKKNEFIVY